VVVSADRKCVLRTLSPGTTRDYASFISAPTTEADLLGQQHRTSAFNVRRRRQRRRRRRPAIYSLAKRPHHKHAADAGAATDRGGGAPARYCCMEELVTRSHSAVGALSPPNIRLEIVGLLARSHQPAGRSRDRSTFRAPSSNSRWSFVGRAFSFVRRSLISMSDRRTRLGRLRTVARVRFGRVVASSHRPTLIDRRIAYGVNCPLRFSVRRTFWRRSSQPASLVLFRRLA